MQTDQLSEWVDEGVFGFVNAAPELKVDCVKTELMYLISQRESTSFY